MIIVGGPYDPITLRIIPVFILYTILFPVVFIFASKLIRKGRQDGLKSALFLGASFLFYGIAIVVAFIGLLEVIISGEFREIYRLSLPLGYSFGIIGNLCLLFFGFSLFGVQKTEAIIFITWAIITLVLINLDANWYGVPHSMYTGQFSMRLYSSLSMTLFAWSILSYLITKINALKMSKPLIGFGYRLIVWSLVSFILFWVCVTLDAVYINIVGEGFSFFTHLAWIFALVFWMLSYIGLIMPSKIKDFIDKRMSKSAKKNP